MQLPFTIEFTRSGTEKESTSRSIRRRVLWLSLLALFPLAATAGLYLNMRPASIAHRATDQGGGSAVHIESVPSGAAVLVDGQQRGITPVTLRIPSGSHSVIFRKNGYSDTVVPVQADTESPLTVRATLWLATPRVEALRPPLPGTTISDARFLTDGRVALVVSLPPGRERQAWVREREGRLSRVGPMDISPPGIAIAPDGRGVAYLGGADASTGAGLSKELWLSGDGSRGRRLWTAPGPLEEITDLAWSPKGDYLVASTRESLPSGISRTLIRRLAMADGSALALAVMPAELVPGSVDWSPEADRLAFLARAGEITALCVVNVDGTNFRYLADVARGPTPPWIPLDWLPEGEGVVYSQSPDPVLTSDSAPQLYYDDLAGRPPSRLEGSGHSPVWRDRELLALALPKADTPLLLQAFPSLTDGSRGSQKTLQPARVLGSLGVKAVLPVAARWDAPAGGALLSIPAEPGSGAEHSYWLVDWRSGE